MACLTNDQLFVLFKYLVEQLHNAEDDGVYTAASNTMFQINSFEERVKDA